MEATTRRQFLKKVGGATLGMAAVSGLAGLAACSGSKEMAAAKPAVPNPAPPSAQPVVIKQEPVAFPWPYKKVDPVKAAERAYQAYYNGGCMYGAFEGIVGELRELVGAPYAGFPAAMTKYGAAGVSGWGTLCGTLNGAAAAIYLIHEGKTGNPIINELYAWYGAEALPNYKPSTPKFDKIEASVAESQLCHVSVTRWCEKSGFKALSPERAERCAWLTASVTKYTVELLNKQADNSFAVVHALPASVQECLSCHGKGGVVENVHASAATTCTSCHSDILTKHPIPLKK